jgi:hypothetical protein
MVLRGFGLVLSSPTGTALMPTTGYDEEAMQIGSVRSGTRPRWFKLIALPVFAASIAVGSGLASRLR